MNKGFMARKPYLVLLLLAVLLATGCKKEEKRISDILAISESTEGDKTCMVNESFVYWEPGDQINICCLTNKSDIAVATYSQGDRDGADNQKALFSMEAITVSENGNFVAVFPAYENPRLADGVYVEFPQNQGWRDINSFAKSACPMVAYGNTVEDGILRLQFHNLCGLVRLQIMNAIEDVPYKDATLESLQITSATDNLSGRFQVNNYTQFAPSVSGGTSNTLTITPEAGKEPVVGKQGLVFYVALPATHGTANCEYKNLTLRVTVKGTDGNLYHFEKPFSVTIRRNGITKMPALICTEWVTSTSTESGTTTASISGCGTPERPFLIYDVADLVLLRNAYNGGTHEINGYPITSSTRIHIMRSDIVLTPSNWTESINEFTGQMFYWAAQGGGDEGIKNESGIPIINEVTTGGLLSGITVRGTFTQTVSGTKDYSPLCITNKGHIYDCVAGEKCTTVVVSPQTTRVGGLCVTNEGTIMNSGCRATLVASEVGGICHTNKGTIQRCFVASPMRVDYTTTVTNQSGEAGGVCHTYNASAANSVIEECYFAANTNKSSTKWGGIVYNLTNGTVKKCYVDASGIIQSTNSVGAIVNTMTGGTVDYCWNDADLIFVENNGGLGGIVYEMSGGEVRNCFRGTGTGMLKSLAGYAGGVVARMSGGSIYNSYAYCDLTQTTCTKGAFVGYFSGGHIENCYGLQASTISVPSFCGQKVSSDAFAHCYSHNGDNGTTGYGSFASLLGNLNGWNPPTSDVYRGWVAGNTGNTLPPTFSTTAWLSHQETTKKR